VDDTAAPCETNPADANDNGVTDACERELLGTFQTDSSRLFESTEHVEIWLAYDTDGAASTWVQFQPGIEARLDDQGPFTVETADLTGWDAVEARLTDDVDERLATRAISLDGGRTQLWPADESYLGIYGELDGADIHALSMEVVSWETGPEEGYMSVAWYFYGAADVN
jgi:hypothetical protein